MTKFRTARDSDLAIVASWIESELACRLWCGGRASYPIDLVVLPNAIEFATSDSWTAVSDDLVVAFGQLVSKAGGRLHLARLIAAPSRRGTGFGRRIASHLIATARSRAPSAISLNVFSENTIAIGLYESLGFRAATRPRDERDSAAIYMECPV